MTPESDTAESKTKPSSSINVGDDLTFEPLLLEATPFACNVHEIAHADWKHFVRENCFQFRQTIRRRGKECGAVVA